eukprot:Rhum_TRINITY_DN12950_c0_g1::Rhum_TRINITY_DN12950_c0_g1_i1::g.55659::m.55659
MRGWRVGSYHSSLFSLLSLSLSLSLLPFFSCSPFTPAYPLLLGVLRDLKGTVASAVQVQYDVVVRVHRRVVRDRHQRDAALLRRRVQRVCTLLVHLRRALVDHREHGVVPEHARPRQALLLPARQQHAPVHALLLQARHERGEAHRGQKLCGVVVRDHLRAVRVGDLPLEGHAVREVAVLRHGEHLGVVLRQLDGAGVRGPQPVDRPQQRRLAHAVRAPDHHVLALLDRHRQVLHERLPLQRRGGGRLDHGRVGALRRPAHRGDHRQAVDLDDVALQLLRHRAAAGGRRVALRVHLRLQVAQARRQPLHARDLRERLRHVLDLRRQRLQQRGGGEVRRRDLRGGRRRVAHPHSRDEHAEAAHGAAVLQHVRVQHVDDRVDVRRDRLVAQEACVAGAEGSQLGGGARLHGNLLAVRVELLVVCAQLRLQLLLLLRQLLEAARHRVTHVADHLLCHEEEGEEDRERLGADAVRDHAREVQDVDGRLQDVAHRLHGNGREFLNVVGEAGRRIVHAGVVVQQRALVHVLPQERVVDDLPHRAGHSLLEELHDRRRDRGYHEPHAQVRLAEEHLIPVAGAHVTTKGAAVIRKLHGDQHTRAQRQHVRRKVAAVLRQRVLLQDLQQHAEPLRRTPLLAGAGAGGGTARLVCRGGGGRGRLLQTVAAGLLAEVHHRQHAEGHDDKGNPDRDQAFAERLLDNDTDELAEQTRPGLVPWRRRLAEHGHCCCDAGGGVVWGL